MSKKKKPITKLEQQQILLESEDSWLNIGNFNEKDLFNPLIQIPAEYIGQENLYYLYLMARPEYFPFICKEILNIELLPMQAAILQELWERKFPMLIMNRGGGKCSRNSIVITNDRFVKIEELIPEDYPTETKYYPPKPLSLLGENGFNQVEYVWKKAPEETVKIYTNYRYSLEGRLEHPIRVIRDNKLCWIEMNDIVLNDIVPIDRSPDWHKECNNITPEEGYWMGALVGDGGYTLKNSINFTNASDECINQVSNQFLKKYNKPLKKQSAKHRYVICGTDIRDSLFTEYGFNSSVCAEKDIPSTIWAAPKESVSAFIRGLMDTDGYCHKDGLSVQFSSKSPKLTHSLQFLLTKFGIISKVKKCFNKKYERYYYKLDIRGNALDLYHSQIGFSIKYKQDRLEAGLSRIRNPNADTIPHCLYLSDILSLRAKYVEIRPAQGISRYERNLLSPSRLKAYEISYSTLKKILDITYELSESEEWLRLKSIYDNNYFYDRVTSRESGFGETYDVYIPNDHTYISNGFISHNSFILGVYALLRALLYPGRKIVICGSVFRQSKVIFEYIENIWRNAPILRDMCSASSGPRHDVDMWRFHINQSVISALPIGDGCLSKNTLITYENSHGYINSGAIDDLQKNNRKIYGNGQFNFSDELYNNGFQKTKIITTSRGYSYEGTYNHKMKVMTSVGIKFKRTDQLENSDYLLIDRTERWHNGESYITKEQAYAFGLMTGDGCWTGKYRFGFATQDPELIDGLNIGLDVKFKQCVSDPIHWFYCGKDKVSNFLTYFNIPILYSYEKYIPECIMSSKKEVMTEFLRGVFDTDGHVMCYKDTSKGNSASVGYTTTSKRLAYEMHYVLLQYGIVCKLTSRDRVSDKIKCRRVYELLITGQNLKKFSDKIGFRLKRKRETLSDGLLQRQKNTEIKNFVPYGKNWVAKIVETYPEINNKKNIKKIRECQNISIALFNNFLSYYSDFSSPLLDEARYLCSGNIFYDKVESITDSSCETFDLHVPITHEYCANGFFSHNTNIRGQRANDILLDEFASSSEDIFETVIAGFAAVAPSPAQAVRAASKKKFLEKHNIVEESNIILQSSNQIVLAGTAFYSFNHFCRYWNIWRGIINSKGDPNKVSELFGGEIPKEFNWKDYSVMRIPLEMIPEGFMDEASIARSKATSNSGTYLHEYMACFVSDSVGFFKRSIIEKCVASEKNNISFPSCGEIVYNASLYGSRSRQYIMGIDPAATEDNFAIVILELHADHRRVVYCWTTNKADHSQKQKRGLIPENDYYSYCVRKIRDLMKAFPIERIVLDSQGGGRAILESLENTSQLEANEQPIYCIIDPDKPQDSDNRLGLHIVEPINFVDAKWTTDANQGLCADLENRVLLFPFFDSITLAEVEFSDSAGNAKFDNLEDNIVNIEELKNELSTIVITETATGRPRWDTPDIKGAGSKKGRLKKDRYSALLMANMSARSMINDNQITYDMVGEGGGFINTIRKSDLEGPLFSGNQRWAKALNDLFG